MTSCIYNTDPNWISFLRENGLNNQINFWRKDLRGLNLKPGADFYFKINSTLYIAGRAKFREIVTMSIADAWSKFDKRNGLRDLDEFVARAKLILKAETLTIDSTISCIVLDDAYFLEMGDFIEIDRSFFPANVLAMKFYNDDEINPIANFFETIRVPNTLHDTEEVFNPNLAFSEGEIKIAIHKKRERSKELVKYIKENKKWICEICEMDFKKDYGVKYIEAHHKTPLSSSSKIAVTTSNDIALLCPNCHKAIHKHMVLEPNAHYETLKKTITEILN